MPIFMGSLLLLPPPPPHPAARLTEATKTRRAPSPLVASLDVGALISHSPPCSGLARRDPTRGPDRRKPLTANTSPVSPARPRPANVCGKRLQRIESAAEVSSRSPSSGLR